MRLSFFVFFIFLFVSVGAQTDSLNKGDSSVIKTDSALVSKDSILVADSSFADKSDTLKTLVPPISYIRFDTALLNNHPYFRFDDPIRFIVSARKWEGKELFFYIMLGLLIFFAIIKNTFNRYLQDLSKLFFRTSIKHRQVKDQLMQAPMPSLLLNILFVMTGALFINLVLQHYKLGTTYDFWQLLLLCSLALTAIYLVKFITLKICGWLFRVPNATDAYIFIVFTTNKIVGIVLLPLLVLLAFTKGSFNEVVLTLSFVVVGALFLYRFFLSYVTIHKEVKIHLFHFLLYLCAFEIIPLLLINKLLFHFLS